MEVTTPKFYTLKPQTPIKILFNQTQFLKYLTHKKTYIFKYIEFLKKPKMYFMRQATLIGNFKYCKNYLI